MSSLKKQLANAIKNKVEPGIKKAIKTSAESVGEALVDAATVDTGLFAANWLPGVEDKRTDVQDYGDYGVSSVRSKETRNISEEQAKATATDIPDFEIGQKIWFTNGVEHLDYFDSFSDATLGAKVGRDVAKSKVEK